MTNTQKINDTMKTMVKSNLYAILNSSHALKFLALPATYVLLSYIDTTDAWDTRLAIFYDIKAKFPEKWSELFLAEIYLNLGLSTKALNEFSKVNLKLLKPYLYTDIVILSYLLNNYEQLKIFLRESISEIGETSAIREMIFALLYGYVKTSDKDFKNYIKYLLNVLQKKDNLLFYQTVLDTCYRLSHNNLVTPENKNATLLAYQFLSENQKIIEKIIINEKRSGFDYLFVLTTLYIALTQNSLVEEADKIKKLLLTFIEKRYGNTKPSNIFTAIKLILEILDEEKRSKIESVLDNLLDAIEEASRKFMEHIRDSSPEGKGKSTDKDLLTWYYNLVFGVTVILLFLNQYKIGIEKYLFRSLRLVDYIRLPNVALNLLKEILLFAKKYDLIPKNELYKIFEKYLSLALGSSYYMKVKHTSEKIKEVTIRDTAFAICQFSVFPEFLPHITFTLMDLQRKFPHYAIELANNGIRAILDGIRSEKLGKDLLMKPLFLL